jgi:hypothetical protein
MTYDDFRFLSEIIHSSSRALAKLAKLKGWR